MFKTFAAPAVAAFLAATPALSATLDVDTQGSWAFADADGNNKWYVTTSFEVGFDPVETRTNVGAGVFRLTGTDGDGVMTDFLAFCLQPLEWLTLPKTYEMGTSLASGIVDNINALAANAWLSVTDSVAAAAFQMAVWELANDDGNWDVDDGFFRITGDGTGSNNAETLAQSWLENVRDDVWAANGASFLFLNAPGTQDLITNLGDGDVSGEVPIPASGLLLLGALAAGAGMTRRKR